MTKRQRELVRAVIECQLEGRTLKRKELAARLGIEGHTVSRLLRRAEAQGLLVCDDPNYQAYHSLRVIWPAKNLICPPYKVLWEMVDGRLVYSPRDVGPFPLDHQKGDFSAL